MVQSFLILVRNMRRLVVMLSLACLLLGVLSGLRAQEAQQGKNEEDNGYSQISIFAKTIELIRQDYVDGGHACGQSGHSFGRSDFEDKRGINRKNGPPGCH